MAHTDSPATENETVHHEDTDVDVSGIAKFILYLTLVTVVVHFYVWFLMGRLTREIDDAAVIQYPLAAELGERLPPTPRLQTQPRAELADLRASWKTRLEGYSWVDKQAGAVRLPIEQAMKRVLEAGIPARAAAPPAGSAATTAARPATPHPEPAEKK